VAEILSKRIVRTIYLRHIGSVSNRLIIYPKVFFEKIEISKREFG
jgi:hypothetical protein